MMFTRLSVFLVVLWALISSSHAGWSWANHGKPPVYTGMAEMKSGSNSKLFGVGNGRLQERYWSLSSNQWIWADHGHPDGNFLGATPCVLTDGKLFVVTQSGRLYMRHWTGTWVWYDHGTPGVTLRRISCTCTTRDVHRVFAVGTNFRLYERYWSTTAEEWVWKYHGSPPGTTLSAASPDSCNLPSCDTRVYVVGANKNLYYRYITSLGVAYWVTLGRPSSWQYVNSVSVSPAGVFITTGPNYVYEYTTGPTLWRNHGRPAGSIYHSASLSKAVEVNSCANLPGTARYIVLYSWDPTTRTRGRFFSKKIQPGVSSNFVQHTSAGKSKYYVDRPQMFMNWNCPKIFITRSDGYVFEQYTT